LQAPHLHGFLFNPFPLFQNGLSSPETPGSAQRFLNLQTATHNTFYLQRHFLKWTTFKLHRSDAFDVWKGASSAA
jgi:hypothetical protein